MKIQLDPLSLQADIPPAYVIAEQLRLGATLSESARKNLTEQCLGQMDRIRILALQYKTIWILKHSVVFNGIAREGFVELDTIFIGDRFWQKPDHLKQRWGREKELSPVFDCFKKWLGTLGLKFSAQGVVCNGQEGLWLMVKKPSHKVICLLFGRLPNKMYAEYKKGLESIDSWSMASLIPLQLRVASLTGKDWVNISFAWRQKYIVREKKIPIEIAMEQAEFDWERNLLLLRERLLSLGYTPVFRKAPVVFLRRGIKYVQTFGVMLP